MKVYLLSRLIQQKLLRKFRFFGKWYLVAVDAIGMANFEQKHCDRGLTKTSKTEVVTYFHFVLEAKIVTSTGLSISLASEFFENTPERDYKKQDCEQKTFVRLSTKIKNHFPRLPICFLGDGLYPNNTVFEFVPRVTGNSLSPSRTGTLKPFKGKRIYYGQLSGNKTFTGKQNFLDNY